MKNKYLSIRYFGWNFAIILVLSALSGYIYSQGYFANFANAAEETVNATYNVKTNNDIMNQDGNEISRGTNQMWIGTGKNATRSYLGMRFMGNPIPEGAVIEAAEITFTSATKQWISLSTTIYAENNASPQQFSTSSTPSQRQLLPTTKSTRDNISWEQDKPYSYDITDVVKEAYSTNGMKGSISIIMQGKGNAWSRKFVYGSPNSLKAPKLQIKYTVKGNQQPTITEVPNSPTPTLMAMPSAAITGAVSPTMAMPGHDNTDVTMSHAMGLWSPNTKYDTCTKAEHDIFRAKGPDGKWYPTWHPPTMKRADGTTCTFGHEHGRNPEGSNLLPLINSTYGGILFGYANEKLDEYNAANNIANGMRHEDHVGHKIEWENNVRLTVNKCTRPASTGCFETTPTNITCDFLMKIHQGTHSKDAFSNNLHELAYFVQCNDGTKIAATKMVAFGKPGEFMTTCDKSRTIQVGSATPSNSPVGDGVRFIGDSQCVNDYILVPNGKFSEYSLGLYEDWVSSNYIRTANNTILAYFDPHFAVFSPSRYYDPTKPDNMGRSIDTCYMKEANGDRARGGECDEITNYRDGSTIPVSERISYDDPRSPMNGVHREFYFNQTWIRNTTGNTTWYTDPYGNKASTTTFDGAVVQYIANVDNYNKTIFESQAIGSDRYYGGNGVHAPN